MLDNFKPSGGKPAETSAIFKRNSAQNIVVSKKSFRSQLIVDMFF